LISVSLGFNGIGDRVEHSFFEYTDFPLTVDDAIDQGWTNYTGCNPFTGIYYSQEDGGPTTFHPLTVAFTASGQIAGVGVSHFGSDPLDNLIGTYWLPTDLGFYYMGVTFRDPDFGGGICNENNYFNEDIGTQVVVNQGVVNTSLPLTEDAATSSLYTKGGCIGNMGTHWSYDMETAPDMSWIAANLMPVVPMYTDGVFSAFFF